MKSPMVLTLSLLASLAHAGIIADSDWNVSFSMGRFGPNRAADDGYNGWKPESNDGGGMIFNGGAIGSTSIANDNFDGGVGSSIRTFKKDNPFGPNPNAEWLIEEQLSFAEQSALGNLTQFDAAGKVNVSFWYKIVTGTAIDPRDNLSSLSLVAPTSFSFSLRFYDNQGDGIDGSPTKDPANRELSQKANLTGLAADNTWHQLSFELPLLSAQARSAQDVGGNDNANQPTLFGIGIIGDALSPMDVYLDRFEVTAVPEPSLLAALTGTVSLGFIFWRRRQTR